MPVFKREFLRNFKGLVIWTVSIAGLLALMVSQFKAMGSGVDVSSYSQSFKTAMGLEKVDMNTLLGYYAIKASIMVILFGGIYGAILGSGLVVSDESLLARPVSRGRIASERLLAVSLNMLVFNAAIAAILYSTERSTVVLWIAAAQFLLHMVFTVTGFFIAVMKLKSKAALVMPIGVVLATYVLSIVYGLADKLEFVKYLSPFYYTDSKSIIINGRMNAAELIAVCSLIVLFSAAGFLVYTKRDLPA